MIVKYLFVRVENELGFEVIGSGFWVSGFEL
jgi:hypothetical protein